MPYIWRAEVLVRLWGCLWLCCGDVTRGICLCRGNVVAARRDCQFLCLTGISISISSVRAPCGSLFQEKLLRSACLIRGEVARGFQPRSQLVRFPLAAIQGRSKSVGCFLTPGGRKPINVNEARSASYTAILSRALILPPDSS